MTYCLLVPSSIPLGVFLIFLLLFFFFFFGEKKIKRNLTLVHSMNLFGTWNFPSLAVNIRCVNLLNYSLNSHAADVGLQFCQKKGKKTLETLGTSV
ncbi:hypothetical protein GDO86_007218 [Hymenochirus boettgeri]|uniref:Uncharacterized protein n=1 Tax=Hymenochirus boettgeri TaxID=247094 RepID=A0A8T2IVR1_9PIPI|nr:hypothetical protein GDO86_007218 [Hymenochirus boettgeri]